MLPNQPLNLLHILIIPLLSIVKHLRRLQLVFIQERYSFNISLTG